MPKYNRTIDEIEKQAIFWWPANLNEANADISVIPRLLQTQDDFLKILSLAKQSPYQVFEIIQATKFPANLFLKHLCIIANYGGEPIQRLGRSFTSIFQFTKPKHSIEFIWKSNNYTYAFKSLPLRGLGNKKLFIDGKGLTTDKTLTDLYKDMIILLMFGSTSTVSKEAGLSVCEIGTLLGTTEVLARYVQERYINVSRITGGATANSLGQLAQNTIAKYLSCSLSSEYTVVNNGYIQLNGYDKVGGMPFDIVVEKGIKKIGIEISFQVTTNSTIERKAGQAADRLRLMHSNGYKIAYVVDGAGNFHRRSALATICQNSDCTVAYTDNEFDVLSDWIGEQLD